MATVLNDRAGIIEHGLFVGLATDVVIAGASGVQHKKK
jgi:ribose 5-phosphate isomerase A